MSSVLGIDFFRVVNEGGGGEWSQVFAKVPFDEGELACKGGMFGVVGLSGGEDCVGRGLELITSLEDRYNSFSDGDLLRLMSEVAMNKEDGVRMILVSVRNRDGEREMSFMCTEGCFLDLFREGRRISLSSGDKEKKVIAGKLMVGDRLVMGIIGLSGVVEKVGEKEMDVDLESFVEKVSSELMGGGWQGSIAGLFLRVGENGLVAREVEMPKTKVSGAVDFKGSLLVRSGERNERRGRWMLMLGIVFLVILILSVIGGIRKVSSDTRRRDYLAVVEPIEEKMNSALKMRELNPAGARELMKQVKEEAEKHAFDIGRTEFEKDWREIIKNIESGWKIVSGEEVISPELFFDMAIVRKGFGGKTLGVSDSGLLTVLDPVMGVVVGVSYPEKRSEVLAGRGEGKEWLGVGSFQKNSVLILGRSGFENAGGTVGEYGAIVGKVVGGKVYGGNYYLLDVGNGEIWKYVVGGSGAELKVGEAVRWLKGEAIVELRDGLSLAIDGDVWVGFSDGRVFRFRRGNKEKFQMATNGVGKVSLWRLAVNTEGDDGGRVVILDREMSRLVVFDKKGNFLGQKNWSGFSSAEDLVFVDKKTLMILQEGKLWKVGI